jgi:hypothetical protein
MDLVEMVKNDGGEIYSDDFIIVTPKRLIFSRNALRDGGPDIVPVENMENVSAKQENAWISTSIVGVLALAGFTESLWIGIPLAVVTFVLWKIQRSGHLFLKLSSGDSVIINTNYNSVLKQKEAIESAISAGEN